jgi:uncharacterized protein YgiB involved in biofilm formation
MKRSSHLRLTLMAAAMPVALAGCDQGPPTGEVLSSVDDCSRVSDVSPQECKAAYDAALAQHQNVAPRFESYTDCNDQFGSCTEVTNDRGQTNWIPPMTGFLLGYAVSSALNSNSGYAGRDCARYPDQPGCAGNSGGYRIIGSSPLYRDYRSGDYLKPNGDFASSRTGKVTGGYGRTSAPARAITVSRAGFGSSSSARSSFGGGGRFGG